MQCVLKVSDISTLQDLWNSTHSTVLQQLKDCTKLRLGIYTINGLQSQREPAGLTQKLAAA